MDFYFYACTWSCSYNYGAPHGDPSGRRSSAIKQQFGEEPSPQRRQSKYDASSGVFLTIFEVFGKVLKQSLECLI